MGQVACFNPVLVPGGVTMDVWEDGTVWVNHGPMLQRRSRIDMFIGEIRECYRLRCLFCDGKGYVWSGGDMGSGGPCGRGGETGWDPDPVEANLRR